MISMNETQVSTWQFSEHQPEIIIENPIQAKQTIKL